MCAHSLIDFETHRREATRLRREARRDLARQAAQWIAKQAARLTFSGHQTAHGHGPALTGPRSAFHDFRNA